MINLIEYIIVMVLGMILGVFLGLIIGLVMSVLKKRSVEKNCVPSIRNSNKRFFNDGKEVKLKEEVIEQLGLKTIRQPEINDSQEEPKIEAQDRPPLKAPKESPKELKKPQKKVKKSKKRLKKTRKK